uniref:Uncharacterized protein n=1 Tax=Anguilla anguilla TaxID=7936 RepID=A0A0E9TIF3_ANGAN
MPSSHRSLRLGKSSTFSKKNTNFSFDCCLTLGTAASRYH